MEFIPSYTAYIERALKTVDIPQSPGRLYDPIRYFLSIGGKRMRPILTLLGAELFGLEKERVINSALAVEVFHNFTLIHDDIMDEAPLRRGFETIHTKWDSGTAILSGDVLMIKAYQLLEKQEGDLRQLLTLFNRTAVEVCEGQQLDMDFEKRSDISVEEYTEMIRLKTSVLLGCALEMSAIIAETDLETRKHIYNFGVNVGLAFQVQDDVLDLYADPEKFGKQVGGDVLSNKKTMLYLLAKENAGSSQLQRMETLLHEEKSAKKILETKEIFDQIGAKELCLEKINYYFSLAQQEMEQLNVPDRNKVRLTELSTFLLNREV